MARFTENEWKILQSTTAYWQSIGRSTRPVNRDEAEAAVRMVYAQAGMPQPRTMVWVPSPAVGYFLDRWMRTGSMEKPSTRGGSEMDGLSPWTRLTQARIDQWMDCLSPSIHAEIELSAASGLRRSMMNALMTRNGLTYFQPPFQWTIADVAAVTRGRWKRFDTVRMLCWDQSVLTVVGGEFALSSVLLRSGCGSMDAAGISLHACLKYLGADTSRLEGIMEVAETCGWWWPYDDMVIISDRPTVMELDDNLELHNQTGPALSYPDGWSVYALNGVRVPQWLVETPAEQIDAHELFRTENAEVRREIVRKVGIERVCRDLGAKVVDRDGDYELLWLGLEDGLTRPYLKMKNPSIGVYHIEGVHPTCRTVQQALNWRNGFTEAQIDDVHGAEWFEQGDVLLKPKGATTFKSRPRILT